jgi:Kef-type K+ transport system membrane component KefB
MASSTELIAEIAWPLALLVAWLAGELAFRWLSLPRIAIHAVVGFALAPTQLGFLPAADAGLALLLANIAFGLILFEAGYRINLRWLRANPWIAVTSVVEASLSFAVVYVVAITAGLASTPALLLAALAMATSPATILRVVNEQRAAGQVTERLLHLSVLNCVLAVLAFKIVVGLAVFHTSGSLWDAVRGSAIVLAASAATGSVAGVALSALLRHLEPAQRDNTLAFAITVITIVALTHVLQLSPVVAALTFGLATRHRRSFFGQSQRGFGALGDILAVLLFVFIAATLDWRHVVAGLGTGIAIVGVRQLAKIASVGAFSYVSGIPLRKGVLVGAGMAPVSAFVVLMLEQTRHLGVQLVDELAPLAALALVLEILGPVIVRRTLVSAREVARNPES